MHGALIHVHTHAWYTQTKEYMSYINTCLMYAGRLTSTSKVTSTSRAPELTGIHQN